MSYEEWRSYNPDLDNLFNIILGGLDDLPNTPKVRKLIKEIESLYPDFEVSDDD